MNMDGGSRAPYREVAAWLEAHGVKALQRDREIAERLFRRAGITFQVYTEKGDPERLIPFDVVPRVLTSKEWAKLDRGIRQRALALNMFLRDVYNERRILKEGVVPEEIVLANTAYEEKMVGFVPPHGIYAHIIGTDIVRTGQDAFYVLEDNCRVPSGVSYMLETRETMVRLFPDLFDDASISPVEDYTEALLATMKSVAGPSARTSPMAAVMTPGHFNSAYYEHSFLAEEMGVPLVEGGDLEVEGDRVYLRTIAGRQQVDVLYRRVDDAFLDPAAFRADSMVGTPGLFAAYRAGGITLVNAPGTGVADDKAVYTYVPEMIRFYLDQDPIIPNVETYRCADEKALSHVLEHLGELVVKEVHGSGGYGMLIGPRASKQEIETFRAKLKADPAAFIAQPTLALSTAPTLCEEGVEPRHVDLRPFCLTGANGMHLTRGGLTRVALTKGSLVVNSSQGGGVKDTWVMAHDSASDGAPDGASGGASGGGGPSA